MCNWIKGRFNFKKNRIHRSNSWSLKVQLNSDNLLNRIIYKSLCVFISTSGTVISHSLLNSKLQHPTDIYKLHHNEHRFAIQYIHIVLCKKTTWRPERSLWESGCFALLLTVVLCEWLTSRRCFRANINTQYTYRAAF